MVLPLLLLPLALIASSAIMVAPYANEELKKKQVAKDVDVLGVEELAIDWTVQVGNPPVYTLDGETILLRAKIMDKAGNYPTGDFDITNPLTIDGFTSDHQPTILEASADREGWWGPNSKDVGIDDSPIQILLETSEAITVTSSGSVVPTISLETGTVVGEASYASSYTINTPPQHFLVFHYEPTDGETTIDPGTGEGEPLAFKIDGTIGKAIIDLHGMEMYEVGGNLLVYNAGDLNKSPLLPEPGDATSLDQKSNLIIDGVAPDDFTVDEISTFDANNDQQKSGYYNGLARTIKIKVPLPNDLVTGTKDLTLATAGGADCWTNYTNLTGASGQDCGKIQLMAYALPVGSTESPDAENFLDMYTISVNDLTGDNSFLEVLITHTDFEDPSQTALHYVAGQFADDNLLYISAAITDLAGNSTEGSEYYFLFRRQ